MESEHRDVSQHSQLSSELEVRLGEKSIPSLPSVSTDGFIPGNVTPLEFYGLSNDGSPGIPWQPSLYDHEELLDSCVRAGFQSFARRKGPGADGLYGSKYDGRGGHLIFLRHGMFFAAVFQAAGLLLTGGPNMWRRLFAGESMWNKYNLFTGCVDVPLSSRGIDQAFEAGRRIAAIPVDLVFTSALARSQQTAMIAMTEHLGERVPVVLYTGQNGRAILWSRIHSEIAETHAIPMIRAWELNERMYGHLQVGSLAVYEKMYMYMSRKIFPPVRMNERSKSWHNYRDIIKTPRQIFAELRRRLYGGGATEVNLLVGNRWR